MKLRNYYYTAVYVCSNAYGLLLDDCCGNTQRDRGDESRAN